MACNELRGCMKFKPLPGEIILHEEYQIQIYRVEDEYGFGRWVTVDNGTLDDMITNSTFWKEKGVGVRIIQLQTSLWKQLGDEP